MVDLATPIIAQLGVGGIGGFLVGYTVKKVAKILAVLLGLAVLGALYLTYIGVINVNYDKLASAVSGILPQLGKAGDLLVNLTASLPFAGAFIVGLVLGLKKG